MQRILLTSDRSGRYLWPQVAWFLTPLIQFMPEMGVDKTNRIKGFLDAFNVNMGRTTWFRSYEAALGHEVP